MLHMLGIKANTRIQFFEVEPQSPKVPATLGSFAISCCEVKRGIQHFQIEL